MQSVPIATTKENEMSNFIAELEAKPEETKPAEATAPAAEGEEPAKSGLSTAARRQARSSKARHSKRFTALEKSLAKETFFPTQEGITKIKALATAKFDETIETAVNLGVDPRHGDQMVRGTTNLPFGTGKSRVVWVFARGEKAADATAAGADLVGAEDLLEKIQKEGGATCDLLVATPDMMPLVGRLGQILKQKMPNPKAGTVSPNIGQVVRDIKGATQANFVALIGALLKAKPGSSKGKYIEKVSLTSSMGPSLVLDVADVLKISEKV